MMYTLGYTPLLYYTATRDSLWCVKFNRVKGEQLHVMCAEVSIVPTLGLTDERAALLVTPTPKIFVVPKYQGNEVI
jgi:hypothetical protein